MDLNKEIDSVPFEYVTLVNNYIFFVQDTSRRIECLPFGRN